jgi:hypothetical protein
MEKCLVVRQLKNGSSGRIWTSSPDIIMELVDIPPSPEFEKALAACSPHDFDGHTEFSRLTSEQRLEWLYQAATFVSEFCGLARTEVRSTTD